MRQLRPPNSRNSHEVLEETQYFRVFSCLAMIRILIDGLRYRLKYSWRCLASTSAAELAQFARSPGRNPIVSCCFSRLAMVWVLLVIYWSVRYTAGSALRQLELPNLRKAHHNSQKTGSFVMLVVLPHVSMTFHDWQSKTELLSPGTSCVDFGCRSRRQTFHHSVRNDAESL